MDGPGARKRRVGIVGFGLLGQYLVERIASDPSASAALELAFVWNRSPDRVAASPLVPESARCHDLADAASFSPDIIVEVCHPDVTRDWGVHFLRIADLYAGSPTAFADEATNAALRAVAAAGPHALYIPAGALWGAADVARMDARGALAGLRVTMKKHPASLKLGGALGEAVARLLQEGGAAAGETVLYEGPVGGLAPLAPNNVNTMAAAAIAAPSLGFGGVVARLVADARLDAHVITVEATGLPPAGGGPPFTCVSERYNPAPPGAVTGQATYAAFLSSLLAAARGGLGPGLHMC